MPTITRQSPNRKQPTAVAQPLAAKLGIKIGLFGRSKTGKTRLLSTLPKPLMIIGTEDGTKSICTGRVERETLGDGTVIWDLTIKGKPIGIHFCRISRSEHVDNLVAYSGEYVSYGLDHGGGLQDIVLKEVLGLDELPVQRSWGMAKQGDWQVVGQQMKERLTKLLSLADRKGTNVMIIAHERTFGEGDPASDIMVPSVGAALSPSTTNWLNGACDHLGQTFVREKTREVAVELNGHKVGTRTEKAGGIEFCLRTGQHPVYMTGFRVSPETVLPDVIVDPTYEKISQLLQG